MPLIVEFTCELPNGVHARPASHVETLCNTFTSQIEWHNLRTDRKGSAKSALALIGTDTLAGDHCQLVISGADEQVACQRLSQWLRDEFPLCDAPLAEIKNSELEPLPASLTQLNPQIYRARSVCSGSAGGVLTPLSSLDLNALGELPTANDTETEQAALDNGLAMLIKHIEFRQLDSDGAASAILEAHRSLAGDASLRQHLLDGVLRGLSCAQAIVESANHFCNEFARASSSYLQERALDVRDVCFQLLQHIYGEQRFPAPGQLTRPSICMAEELTPSQFLELDKTFLKGLLLKSGGTTSHTVILARSFNIPTLVGVEIEALTPWRQQTVYIDGNAGAIVVAPDEPVTRYYQQEARLPARVGFRGAGGTSSGQMDWSVRRTGGQRFGSAIAGRSGAGRDQHGRAVDSRRQSADGTTRQPSLPPVVESGDGLPHLAGGGASAGAVPHVAAGCPAGYRPMHNA